jgi:hypothetical protein
MIRQSLEWLGERSRPHYGQLTLVVLLVCGLAFCWYFQGHYGETRTSDERTGPVSVFSFLPDAVLLNRPVFRLCGVLFAAGAVLWAGKLWLPWSGWLAALSFTAVVALYLENASQVTHVAHLTNTLLIVYALWYHFYARDIRAAARAGRFWTTPLFPRWVYSLSVFSVGMFYGWSGLSKLLANGPGWANGVSLQLWVSLFGDPHSVCTRLILSDRRLATALQTLTLVGETGGFLAIVVPGVRPLVGVTLIGFHLAAISVFGWGFHANLLLVGLVFLPCHRWVRWCVERWEERRRAGEKKERPSRPNPPRSRVATPE